LKGITEFAKQIQRQENTQNENINLIILVSILNQVLGCKEKYKIVINNLHHQIYFYLLMSSPWENSLAALLAASPTTLSNLVLYFRYLGLITLL